MLTTFDGGELDAKSTLADYGLGNTIPKISCAHNSGTEHAKWHLKLSLSENAKISEVAAPPVAAEATTDSTKSEVEPSAKLELPTVSESIAVTSEAPESTIRNYSEHLEKENADLKNQLERVTQSLTTAAVCSTYLCTTTYIFG